MSAPAPSIRDLSLYRATGFDRGAPRWKEAAWVLVKWAFFETAFPWPSALRVALLRLFGAHIGRGVVVRNWVNITFPWRLTVGDHVWIGEEVFILSLAPVTLEDSVCLSQRAFLCTGSHDAAKPTFDLITGPITIRRGGWIAAQAFIGPNVDIGPGSVISAGSVITRPVEPGVLMRGNPAEIARRLTAGT
jgi:putative colanic acid biosynthesis acetyltransferase WcaF